MVTNEQKLCLNIQVRKRRQYSRRKRR